MENRNGSSAPLILLLALFVPCCGLDNAISSFYLLWSLGSCSPLYIFLSPLSRFFLQAVQDLPEVNERKPWQKWDESTFARYISLVEDTSLVGRGLLGAVMGSANMQSLSSPSLDDAPDLSISVEVNSGVHWQRGSGKEGRSVEVIDGDKESLRRYT